MAHAHVRSSAICRWIGRGMVRLAGRGRADGPKNRLDPSFRGLPRIPTCLAHRLKWHHAKGDRIMIAIKTALAIVAALTFALGAVAGPAGSRNDGNRRIELTETSVLLGATVRPGSYDLKWAREPGSEEVKIEVTSGKTVVASGKGLWIA